MPLVSVNRPGISTANGVHFPMRDERQRSVRVHVTLDALSHAGPSAGNDSLKRFEARHLQSPLILQDRRRIETVQDALDVIASLPESQRTTEAWELTVDALTAAGRGHSTRFDLAAAQRRLTTALKAEGML